MKETPLDHHEQHHEHHQHEREHEKKLEKAHEHAQEQSAWPIHPKWFVAIGVAAVVIAMLIWTFLVW